MAVFSLVSSRFHNTFRLLSFTHRRRRTTTAGRRRRRRKKVYVNKLQTNYSFGMKNETKRYVRRYKEVDAKNLYAPRNSQLANSCCCCCVFLSKKWELFFAWICSVVLNPFNKIYLQLGLFKSALDNQNHTLSWELLKHAIEKTHTQFSRERNINGHKF